MYFVIFTGEYIIGDGVVSNKRIVTITPKEEGMFISYLLTLISI